MTGVVMVVVILLLAGSLVLTVMGHAVFQVSPQRLRTLAEEGFAGADALTRLRAEPGHVKTGLRLVASVLALTAVGVAVSFGSLAWGVPGGSAAVIITALVVFLVADVIPRGIAARRPVRIALMSAPLLLAASRPITLLAMPFALIEGRDLGNGSETGSDERQLREIQELGQEEGVLGEEENLLIERAFRLDELTTWDVMTPRVDVFAWRETQTLGEILESLPTVPYSRVPVYADSVDDITGIVYVREAYQAYIAGGGDALLSTIAREPFFVPGSVPLSHLLQDFQNRRIHMGIVADEFGGTDGLVTLEDVLEELVGEIVDETDVDEEAIIHVSDTEVIADAGEDLRDINYALDVTLPHNDHRSLNGFILEELGYVPSTGERITRSGVEIEVLEASETQVVRARLTKLPPALPTDEDD